MFALPVSSEKERVSELKCCTVIQFEHQTGNIKPEILFNQRKIISSLFITIGFKLVSAAAALYINVCDGGERR